MNTNTPLRFFGWRYFFLALAAGLLLGSTLGCSSGYGRLHRDHSVTAAFEKAQFSSEYRFYYIGRKNQPYAIVGIQEGYEFRSKFWESVDPGTEIFRKMVEHPWGFQHQPPYGAYILDSKGNRVGIWFSSFDLASIRVTDDRGVLVYNPYSPTLINDPAMD
ncbi:MAG: hypothetical protein PVG78_00430 [Desulfobacterales bacterium]